MRARGVVITGLAALAACGVLGMAPPAVQASSASIPTWAKQHPAVHPPARADAVMAYDAATRTVVLFGGLDSGYHGDTWTWNGTTWTQQYPAVHPPARADAVMAYDAATRTMVLFSGRGPVNHHAFGDTWTWNGTTWTQQHPAVSPPARVNATMAYDAATSTMVLFGGHGDGHRHFYLGDTWTWNGTTWTRQHPAVSPPARFEATTAYDAATGTAVLFGGYDGRFLGDTWTWNGTTWTSRHPAVHPPARWAAAMAYDAATGTVVLFGGLDARFLGDTWTWNGTTWTQQHPAVHPHVRTDAVLAYDAAAGTTVLFGGAAFPDVFSGTWTWG